MKIYRHNNICKCKFLNQQPRAHVRSPNCGVSRLILDTNLPPESCTPVLLPGEKSRMLSVPETRRVHRILIKILSLVGESNRKKHNTDAINEIAALVIGDWSQLWFLFSRASQWPWESFVTDADEFITEFDRAWEQSLRTKEQLNYFLSSFFLSDRFPLCPFLLPPSFGQLSLAIEQPRRLCVSPPPSTPIRRVEKLRKERKWISQLVIRNQSHGWRDRGEIRQLNKVFCPCEFRAPISASFYLSERWKLHEECELFHILALTEE